MFDILCYENNFADVDIASVTTNSKISEVTDFDIIKGITTCTQNKFATMEHDKWRLDGTYRIFSDKRSTTNNPVQIDTKLAYWSGYMSNASGVFDTAPYIEIAFASEQTTDAVSGVTIVSGDKDDYCTSATMTLYSNGTAIKTYQVTSDTYIMAQRFETDEDVTFTSVRITFNRTNKPKRFIRLSTVKMKMSIHLMEDKFYDVRLLEEISIISDTLPYGTLSFTLSATKSEIAELSKYKYMELYKNCVQFGGFYLDEIKKVTIDKYTVSLNDAVKVLDDMPQPDAMYITTDVAKISVATVMKDILSNTNIPLILTEDYSNSEISIEIHNDTKRTALAKILYITNSTCKKMRNGSLWIGKLDTTKVKQDITENIFDDCEITDNVPILNLSMQRSEISEGSKVTLNGSQGSALITISEKAEKYILITATLPDLAWSPSAEFSLNICGELETKLNDGSKLDISFYKEDLPNQYTPFTVGTNSITIRIDKNMLQRSHNNGSRRDITWWEKDRRSGRWLYRSEATWVDLPMLIKRADFTTFQLRSDAGYRISMPITYNTLKIGASQVWDSINNDVNALKTRNLQIQTLTLAHLVIDGTMEFGTRQNTVEVEEENGQVTTQTAIENINLILPKLMDRYYKYNKEFAGTILADGLECGDTVSMNLHDIGYTTGTITQLEYNLTNKEIARAKILLYSLD